MEPHVFSRCEISVVRRMIEYLTAPQRVGGPRSVHSQILGSVLACQSANQILGQMRLRGQVGALGDLSYALSIPIRSDVHVAIFPVMERCALDLRRGLAEPCDRAPDRGVRCARKQPPAFVLWCMSWFRVAKAVAASGRDEKQAFAQLWHAKVGGDDDLPPGLIANLL